MLVYVVTVATSAFFVPHYLSIFWEPLKTNPWDIVGGAVVIVVLVTLNIVGVQEAAKLSIVLAVLDFATQVLLVLLGFFLVFSPTILVDNIHWGVAPTWSNLAIAVPVAMLAYTGVETVSNLAEEAREPARSVPDAYKLVAGAVFAIYLTLPLVALSALPVKVIDGQLTTLLALPPEEGGYANDPILGLVQNLGVSGVDAARARDLRRGARGDDPLHRHECRRDRRLSGHLFDGELPADPRGVPPAAPEVQDARALARHLRRHRADPDHSARRRELRRHALLVRRDPLVHRRPLLARPAADEAEGLDRDVLPGSAEPHGARESSGRCSRSSAGSPPAPRSSSSSPRTRRRGGSGSGGSSSGLVFYVVYRRRFVHASLRETREGAARVRARRSRSSTGASSFPSSPASRRTMRSTSPAASPPSAVRESSRSTCSRFRWARPLDDDLDELEDAANDELDEAIAIGDSYGVRVLDRLVRARSAGPAIVEEAERRGTEIIVIGSPRKSLTATQRAVFGRTVDYVLRHAPCRVMVSAARDEVPA